MPAFLIALAKEAIAAVAKEKIKEQIKKQIKKTIKKKIKAAVKKYKVFNSAKAKRARAKKMGEIKKSAQAAGRSVMRAAGKSYLTPKVFRAKRDADGRYAKGVSKSAKILDAINSVLNPRPYRAPRNHRTGEFREGTTALQKALTKVNAFLNPQIFRTDNARRLYEASEHDKLYSKGELFVGLLNEILNARRYPIRFNRGRVKKDGERAELKKTGMMVVLKALINYKGLQDQQQTNIARDRARKLERSAEKKGRNTRKLVRTMLAANSAYANNQKLISNTANELGNLVKLAAGGHISKEVFRASAISTLKESHAAAMIMGTGGLGNVSQNHLENLDQRLSEQLEYFDEFLQDMVEDEEAGEGGAGKYVSRMASFARSTGTTYQQAERQFVANESDGSAMERRVVSGGESCEDCLAMAAEGWVEVGTLPQIGESACGNNCLCYFEYREGQMNDEDDIEAETLEGQVQS